MKLISWSITSHWGDFTRVQGRLTSDQYHRALDQDNNPDPEAVIRPAYATDLGFLHSEQAINLVSIYQVQETAENNTIIEETSYFNKTQMMNIICNLSTFNGIPPDATKTISVNGNDIELWSGKTILFTILPAFENILRAKFLAELEWILILRDFEQIDKEQINDDVILK